FRAWNSDDVAVPLLTKNASQCSSHIVRSTRADEIDSGSHRQGAGQEIADLRLSRLQTSERIEPGLWLLPDLPRSVCESACNLVLLRQVDQGGERIAHCR